MNITHEKLIELHACQDGIHAFDTAFPNGGELSTVVEWCVERNTRTITQYAHWLMTRLMNKCQRVQYAVFSARSVLSVYESKYPNDKRPRLAIEAAEKYIIEPCADAAADANDAASDANDAAADANDAAADANDAYADAHAAYAAAHAAYAADAAHAAYAAYAAHAAHAADAADAAAAIDAAYAAADANVKSAILRYGVKLLTEGA